MAKPDTNEREEWNYRQCYSDTTRGLTNKTSYFAKTCHKFGSIGLRRRCAVFQGSLLLLDFIRRRITTRN
jgi:hypothetical protein